MSNVIVEEGSLQNTADAIREKLGTNEKIKASQFAEKIGQIKTGGGTTTIHLQYNDLPYSFNIQQSSGWYKYGVYDKDDIHYLKNCRTIVQPNAYCYNIDRIVYYIGEGTMPDKSRTEIMLPRKIQSGGTVQDEKNDISYFVTYFDTEDGKIHTAVQAQGSATLTNPTLISGKVYRYDVVGYEDWLDIDNLDSVVELIENASGYCTAGGVLVRNSSNPYWTTITCPKKGEKTFTSTSDTTQRKDTGTLAVEDGKLVLYYYDYNGKRFDNAFFSFYSSEAIKRDGYNAFRTLKNDDGTDWKVPDDAIDWFKNSGDRFNFISLYFGAGTDGYAPSYYDHHARFVDTTIEVDPSDIGIYTRNDEMMGGTLSVLAPKFIREITE